jgi:tryptophan synthase
MKILCKIADSFIYVVSRMGVTGATGQLSSGLPDLLAKVHKYSGNIPAAVGFGVSTREHFVSVAGFAEGVVIGSQIITTIANAPPGEAALSVREYCASISGRDVVGRAKDINKADLPTSDPVNGVEDSVPSLADKFEELSADGSAHQTPARFGEFGGQYVPESLMDCLAQLEDCFNHAKDDPEFWKEYRSYYPYMGRPGQLHLA